MIDNRLTTYISVISNGSIIPTDDYIGLPDDKLIYKLILEFQDKSRTKVSNRVIKKLINKLRMIHPIIRSKTELTTYVVTQKFQNNLIILEYSQGELKDRYKS